MGFSPLSDLLKDQSEKRGMSRQVQAAMLLEYVKSAIAEHFDEESLKSLRVMYVKDGVAVVAVLSPVLAQELKLREKTIVTQVNSRIGSEVVRGIRYLS